jgi:hypothetical protein
MMVKCASLRDICDQLNQKNEQEGRGYTLSYQQIHYDTKLVYQEWRERRARFVDIRMEMELAKLDKIEAECWAAWERSKEGRRKTIIEGGSMAGNQMTGGSIKERRIENTWGDVRFLEVIQKSMEKRAALLGLNAPVKILAGIVNGISEMSEDEIDREIKEWKKLP